MQPIAFIDTETLGLDPDRHAIWEVGLILWDPVSRSIVSEHLWQIRLTEEQVHAGDPVGMEIGGFADRYIANNAYPVEDFLHEFLALTSDRTHLAGAVVSFDEERLRRMAAAEGFTHGWHYHLIDVENLAIGYLHGLARGEKVWSRHEPAPLAAVASGLPWKSDDLTAALGLDPVPEDERHTALGDARWALRIYEAVTR